MSVHWGGKGPGHVSRWPKAVGPVNTYSGATMLLDFLNPVLDPRITFSRGTGATRVNASGFIEVVGNDTPRFDFDPVTLAPRGLLIEEARTNLLTYSDQFDNAAWTKLNTTITANNTPSPDGTTNADLLNQSVVNASYTQVQVTAAIGTYTATAFAKAGSLSWFRLSIFDTAHRQAWFNLSTGAIGTRDPGVTASITSMGNGWYRCAVTYTTAAVNPFWSVYLTNADTGVAQIGTGFLYGAQLEAGSFATSYIPTVASTVTRNADVAIMTGTNFSSWYNQPEGTLVVDADTVTGASNRVVELSAGSTTRVVDLLMSAPFLQMFNGTSSFNATGNVPLNTPFKAAGAYRTGNYGVVLNGAAVTTNTDALVNTANALQIGRFSSGSNYLNGHIRTIAYYNTRLPNAQLQTLTAPSLAPTLSLDFTTGSYNVGF